MPGGAQLDPATLTLNQGEAIAHHVTAPSAKIGRFEMRRKLGEGAFGKVYEAYDPQLNRAVAIKVAKLGRGDSDQHIKRFLREANAAARLRHPHIVPVHEFGQEGDQLFIVSSFIKGRTLQADRQDRNWKNQPADLQRAARIVQQLAEALAYAHDQGIVHRNVKPANIMLDDKDEPMLMDFGQLTHAGVVLGNLLYTAPEQIQGKAAEAFPASNQYSLGVILYEMIAGQPPSDGTPKLVMSHHMETKLASPRQHNRAISRDLESICMKCLSKNATGRYKDCRALAEDFQRFLTCEPVLARPLGTVERLWRWCRRKPVTATLVFT
jgi:serine/threonine protein kinase